jgi:hypothetical protein
MPNERCPYRGNLAMRPDQPETIVYVIAAAGEWRLIEAIRRTDIGATVLDPGQRAMVPKSAVRPCVAVQTQKSRNSVSLRSVDGGDE